MVVLYLLLVLMTGAVCYAFMARRLHGATVDIFAPEIVIGAFLFLMYVVKPLYIALVGWYGPGINDYYRHPVDYAALAMAQAIVLAGIVVFVWAFHMFRAVSLGDVLSARGISVPLLKLGLLMLYAIVLGVAYYLLRQAGSMEVLLKELESRHSFYEGKGALFFILTLANILFMICAYLHAVGRIRTRYLVAALVLTGLADVMTGTRLWLLFGLLVPYAIFHHYTRRRLRAREVLVGGLVLLLLFVTVRVLTRDVNHIYNRGVEPAELVVATLMDLPNYLLGNIEVTQFDALVTIVEHTRLPDDLTMGSSVLRILADALPASVFQGELPRGNLEYTLRFYPEFNAIGGAAMTSSYIGDLYLNFALPGVLVGMLLLGVFAKCIASWRGRSSFDTAMYAFFIIQVPVVFRVDLQQLWMVCQMMLFAMILMTLARTGRGALAGVR